MMLPFSRSVTCRGRCYHGRNYYGRKPIPQQGNPARSRPLLVSGNEFVEPGDRGRFFPVLRANATRPLSCAGDSPAEALACIRRLHDRVRFLGRGREPFAPRVLPCSPHRGRIFAFSRPGGAEVCIVLAHIRDCQMACILVAPNVCVSLCASPHTIESRLDCCKSVDLLSLTLRRRRCSSHGTRQSY